VGFRGAGSSVLCYWHWVFLVGSGSGTGIDTDTLACLTVISKNSRPHFFCIEIQPSFHGKMLWRSGGNSYHHGGSVRVVHGGCINSTGALSQSTAYSTVLSIRVAPVRSRRCHPSRHDPPDGTSITGSYCHRPLAQSKCRKQSIYISINKHYTNCRSSDLTIARAIIPLNQGLGDWSSWLHT
jgi:hypothetical protein